MYNYLLKVTLFLLIVSPAYVFTFLQCGTPYGILSKNVIDQEYHYFYSDSFTWIVLIKKINYNDNNNYVEGSFCRGFLISPTVVLTAAHCLQNVSKDSLSVQSGPIKKKTIFEDHIIHIRNVSKILFHPNYRACDVNFNHVILILTEPFPLSLELNSICLPTFDQLSAVGNCGLTSININTDDLWTIPGKSNMCEVFDSTNRNSLAYMRTSCERGNNNTDLILAISAELMSCEIPSGSNQFFYFGLNIDVLYNCNYRTNIMSRVENPHDYINWIAKTLLGES